MIMAVTKAKIKGFDRQVTSARCFTDEEMNMLIDVAESDIMTGTIGGKIADPLIRRSKVHWLEKEKFNWVYQKLWKSIFEVNENNYGFSIKRFEGRLQIARYHESNEGHYTWHMDNGTNTPGRKISLSVQLSDPSDYDGGDLGFFYTNIEKMAARERGAIVTFPSWVMHRVSPVTRGVRYSLIAWIVGPRWK